MAQDTATHTGDTPEAPGLGKEGTLHWRAPQGTTL